MNAEEPGRRCPICREQTAGGSCTCEMPCKIVVLQIDEWTPGEALSNLRFALARAAKAIAQQAVN